MEKTDQQQPHDPGSFLTGLGVGLIGGAVGYFLFATDKGEDVRKQLREEWQAVQQSLADGAAATTKHTGSSQVSLRETVTTYFKQVLEQAQQEQQSAEAELAKKKKSKSKRRVFKNVDS